MKPEQEEFLRRRLREAIAARRELKELVRVLLKLGGEFVVAPPSPDLYLADLIAEGFVFGGPVVLKKGRVSECHENVSRVWGLRRYGIVGIGTGYGLSGDGLWRQHSWGILRDGLLETTMVRRKYFGVCLQGILANEFSGLPRSTAGKRKRTVSGRQYTVRNDEESRCCV